jgi:hypothetical protein
MFMTETSSDVKNHLGRSLNSFVCAVIRVFTLGHEGNISLGCR